MMSTGSNESTSTSSKKILLRFVGRSQSLLTILAVRLVGVLSFFVMLGCAGVQYYLTSSAISKNYSDWQDFDWPTVYQQNLFTMMKQMNVLTLLNRTDNKFYFPITTDQSKELITEAAWESWSMKTANQKLLGYMS